MPLIPTVCISASVWCPLSFPVALVVLLIHSVSLSLTSDALVLLCSLVRLLLCLYRSVSITFCRISRKRLEV